ncbi:pecanex-like protein 4 isoform X2 [Conger conger]|uniref:pecanex-like protein 4 isoform X2 n=1 Tax=Conger conger TaxID=82655 RepID=UPI002A5B03CD|nr:pecanex-like protein 4 isoform X2 [Conger conger]
MGPDVPLLNEYKQEFFWKRFPQTVLGGPRFKLGYCAPPYIYVNQIILFLTPWVFGGVGTLLYQLQLLEDYHAAALSGGLMLGAAVAVQAVALCAMRKTGTVERLHTPNILADEEEVEFSSCTSSETVKFIVPGKKYVLNTVLHSVLAGALCGLGTWYLLLNRLTSLYSSTGVAVLVFVLSWVTLCIGEYSLVINTAAETATFQAPDTYEITPLTRPLYIFAFIAVDLAQRLLGMFMVSVCVAVSVFFIPSTLGVVLFSVAMGFLLSLDLSQAGALLRSCGARGRGSEPSRALGWRLGGKELLLYLSLLLAAMTEAGLLHHFLPPPRNWTMGAQAVVSYLLIALFALSWALREMQGVYLLGGVFHNPLYPKETTSVRVFKQQSRGLQVAGMVRRVLVNLVSPFAMIAFLAVDGSLQRLHTASLCMGFTRAFRTVWQSTEDSLLQMVVVAAVRLGAQGVRLLWWDSLGTGVQLLLVSLISDRLEQFAVKLKFALTVLVTSWTEKKQRRQSAGMLLALNGVLSPLLLAVLVLSAVLSAPLLPLFTLPVFLVGFPRPERSWPGPVGTACSCPDSVYYQQMSGSLACALSAAFARGALGSPKPGSHFLGRFQDRVVWILVLERGFGYCCLNIKGLELQETSCHTAEARRVDEVFETAFESPEGLGRGTAVNLHWGNVLTPCASLPVRVYSDARSVLTGIIDSHDNLRQLREDFLKVLVWVLLQHCVKRRKAFPGSAAGEGRKPQSARTQSCVEPSAARSKTSSLKPRRESPSLNSFSDWSDEDDLFGPQPARRTAAQVNAGAPGSRTELQTGPSLPGSVEIDSLFGDVALSALRPLQPLGLGLPAADKGRGPESLGLPVAALPRLNFSSRHSELLNLPSGWRSAPLPAPRLQQARHFFPEEWFRFALGRVELAGQGDCPQEVAEALQLDEGLRELHAQVALSCFISLGAESSVTSPSYVYRVYCGDVPWTEGLDWLTANAELFQLTLKAFRYSFKLLFDQASLGAVESPEELLSTLEDYERDWYIGLVSERGWQEAVLQEKPYLFSLGHDLTMGTYTGRMLTLQEMLVQVGRLNREGVRGQWANLSWELLYATNDDEERYSIQAHPVLLRNLTVQAADPPLGYPIYSSAPVHLPCL